MGFVNLSLSHLPPEVQDAMVLAKEVAPKSYNRYSGYQVGAVALGRDGRMFASAFLENASYGLTVCAEPGALMAANSAGCHDVASLVVVGGAPASPIGPPCTPCGRCRQVIWEYAQRSAGDMAIYCSDLALTNLLLVTATELLPYTWGASQWVSPLVPSAGIEAS